MLVYQRVYLSNSLHSNSPTTGYVLYFSNRMFSVFHPKSIYDIITVGLIICYNWFLAGLFWYYCWMLYIYIYIYHRLSQYGDFIYNTYMVSLPSGKR